jgi:hypothetical protein
MTLTADMAPLLGRGGGPAAETGGSEGLPPCYVIGGRRPPQVHERAYVEAVDAETVAAARGGDAKGVEQLGNLHLHWQLPRPTTARNPSPSTSLLSRPSPAPRRLRGMAPRSGSLVENGANILGH